MVNQVSPDVASLLMGDADTLVQQNNAQVIDPDLGVVVPQGTTVVHTQEQSYQENQGNQEQQDMLNPENVELRTQEQLKFEEWKKQRGLNFDKQEATQEAQDNYYGNLKEELDNKINELFNDIKQNNGNATTDDNVDTSVNTSTDTTNNSTNTDNNTTKDLDIDYKNIMNEYQQLQEKYESLHKIAVEETEEKKWLKHAYEKLEENYKELLNKAEFLEQSMRNRTNIPAQLQDLVYYYEEYMKAPDNKLSEIKAVTVGINFLENITGIDLSPYLASYNGNPKNSSGSNYSTGGSTTVPHIQPRKVNEPKIQTLTQDVF